MKREIAIIGGGASGFLTAITAKKNGKDVVILERKDRVLKKVLTTGNGRCNLTNVNASNQNYFGIEKMRQPIEKILGSFTSQDAMRFLKMKLELFATRRIEERFIRLADRRLRLWMGLDFMRKALE